MGNEGRRPDEVQANPGRFPGHDRGPIRAKIYLRAMLQLQGAFRDMLDYYQATARFNVRYGGIVELMANAMVIFDRPYFEWLEK
jgi:hypothetical protein